MVKSGLGRVGSAFDNAMAEAFSYLEGYPNSRRRHFRQNNPSPADYETMHLTQNEASTSGGYFTSTYQLRNPG